MTIVQIDFNNFLKNSLPSFLRGAINLNWLYSLLKPLRSVHTVFMNYYNDKAFFLQHTAQAVYLEHYLNTKYNIDNTSAGATPAHPFNAANHDIYIETNDLIPDYIFNDSEVIDNSDKVYVYNTAEVTQEYYMYNVLDVSLGNGFTVYVPNSIMTAKPWVSSPGLFPTVTKVNAVITGAVNKFKFANISFDISNY